MDTPPVTSAPSVIAEDKTVAIVSYLTLIGFIVAIVLHGSKKTKLGAFHLRQTLGLLLTGLCTMILAMIPIIGGIAASLVGLALFVLWILGLVSALNGQLKPLPVIGEYYQSWFGNTFE